MHSDVSRYTLKLYEYKALRQGFCNEISPIWLLAEHVFSHRPHQIKRKKGFRLELETLEGRVVPSTLQVNLTTDSSSPTSGMLRYAVNQANTDAAAGISDSISLAGLASGSTITLSAGTLTFGAGSGTTTIDGSAQHHDR